jgi:glycosyltransferase involved in cell wall biosynthesis
MRLLVHGGNLQPGFPGELAAQIAASGWDVETLSESRSQAVPCGSWRSLCDRCAGWRPDVLLACGERAVRLCAAASLRFRLPFVAVADGREPPGKYGCTRALTRWSYGRASAVICVSEFARRRMVQAGTRPRRVETVPNGFDEAVFRPLDRHEIDVVRSSLPARASRWIVTPARGFQKRHIEEFVRILPVVLESEPDAHYAIAGPRELRDDIAPLARRRGVAGHVHFLNAGSAGRLARLVGASDLVLAGGRRPDEDDAESDAAVLEAGLCGIPAVVTSNGGAEAVLPGITGVSAPAGDGQALSDGIVWLLADDYRRRQMGLAARRRARERSWPRVAALYTDLFAELAGAGTERPLADVFAQVAGSRSGIGRT